MRTQTAAACRRRWPVLAGKGALLEQQRPGCSCCSVIVDEILQALWRPLASGCGHSASMAASVRARWTNPCGMRSSKLSSYHGWLLRSPDGLLRMGELLSASMWSARQGWMACSHLPQACAQMPCKPGHALGQRVCVGWDACRAV